MNPRKLKPPQQDTDVTPQPNAVHGSSQAILDNSNRSEIPNSSNEVTHNSIFDLFFSIAIKQDYEKH